MDAEHRMYRGICSELDMITMDTRFMELYNQYEKQTVKYRDITDLMTFLDAVLRVHEDMKKVVHYNSTKRYEMLRRSIVEEWEEVHGKKYSALYIDITDNKLPF